MLKSAYVTAKHGLEGLSKVIALEAFVEAAAIDPVHYAKTYFMGAGDAGTDAYRLLQGLDNTSVTNAHELWVLSQQCDERVAAALHAHDWAALPADFAQCWRAYLELFGHRTHALADLASPTWQEDPTPLARLVLSYAGHAVPDPAVEHARLAAGRIRILAAAALGGGVVRHHRVDVPAVDEERQPRQP